jgi:hypothetical protein
MMPFAKRRGRLSRMSQDENKSRYPKKRLKAFRGRGAVYSWLRAHHAQIAEEVNAGNAGVATEAGAASSTFVCLCVPGGLFVRSPVQRRARQAELATSASMRPSAADLGVAARFVQNCTLGPVRSTVAFGMNFERGF